MSLCTTGRDCVSDEYLSGFQATTLHHCLADTWHSFSPNKTPDFSPVLAISPIFKPKKEKTKEKRGREESGDAREKKGRSRKERKEKKKKEKEEKKKVSFMFCS